MRINILFLLFAVVIAQSDNAIITIYKDGTVLVKQPINQTLKKGINEVYWDKIPTTIHYDTPFLNISNVSVLSQRYNNKLFSSEDYFEKEKGKTVVIKPKGRKTITGLLVEISPSIVSISNRDGLITYNRNEVEFLRGDKINQKPILKPFLSWQVKSNKSGNVGGELVYKANQFSWDTVYRLKMIDETQGELTAEAIVSNNTNLDYNNAKMQLVEGNINKLKSNRVYSSKSNVSMVARSMQEQPLMNRESLGDYHIYLLNDFHNLGSKESVTVRMYGPLQIKYKKTYVFENSERRQKEEPLEVEILIENLEDNGLGIPLPDGKVELYQVSNEEGLEFIGADKMGQVPKGQSTKIISGRAFDVIGNRKVLNYNRQRKSEEAVIEIKVTNARAKNIDVLLVEHINGDWIIKDESFSYKKKDASTIQFSFALNGGETKNVYYTYRKEWN